MDSPCVKCSNGPSGFDGHADLGVQSVGDARISMHCRRCGSYWSRTFARGLFTWAAITERMAASPHMGIAVPPLSTTSRDTGLDPLVR